MARIFFISALTFVSCMLPVLVQGLGADVGVKLGLVVTEVCLLKTKSDHYTFETRLTFPASTSQYCYKAHLARQRR